MKLAFTFVAVCSINCQFLLASDTTDSEQIARALHSQTKYVESEIMRVWVTIDALIDEISQSSDAITDEKHKNLANLYFYDCELNDYLSELEVELNRLDNPSETIFPENQFEPLIAKTMTYRLPPDAFPVVEDIRIVIEEREQ